MKILVLSPQWSMDPKLAQSLTGFGIHALVANDSKEAWQILKFHGATIALAVVQREEGASRELEFVRRCKSDPQYKDLPYVLISMEWSPMDFTRHQETPEGANAYLRWPCPMPELAQTLGRVMGRDFAPTPNMPTPGLPKSPPPFAKKSRFDVKVEAVSDVFSSTSTSNQSIVLEAPDFPGSAPSRSLEANPEREFEPSEATIDLRAFEQAKEESVVIEMSPKPETASAAPAVSSESTDAKFVAPPIEIDPSFSISSAIPRAPAIETSPAPEASSVTEPSMVIEPSRVVQTPPPPAIEDVEFIAEAASEMPYLFGKPLANAAADRGPSPKAHYEHPVDDAIVPGGAAHSPDVETLKKYLLLREQDVSALSSQLKAARAENSQMNVAIQHERAQVVELQHLLAERKRDTERFEREKQLLDDAHRAEIAEIKFQNQAKADRVRALELEIREAGAELDRIKERVRTDLRKIRIREKDLETKLELSRKDSETLVAARETKIIELKRKVDLLEFNLDVLQNQLAKERDHSNQLKDRLTRAKQAVKAAGGMLGSEDGLSLNTEEAS